jgi:hypothetical protein
VDRAIVAAMSPRARVVIVVAAAAIAAAGVATVGAVVTREDRGGTEPRKGFPVLVLDLGLRTDSAARRLRRAAGLYASGKREQARAIFEQVDKLLVPSESGDVFARRYYEALQRQPAVVLAHGAVKKVLKQP